MCRTAWTLQFILSDSGVALVHQVAISRHCGSLRKFSALGDDRASIRTACLQDFVITADSPENRSQIAVMVSSWETSKEYLAKEIELRAESKVLGQPRVLKIHERQAMLRAIEAIHGTLGDFECPSLGYLSLKAEETESKEPSASPLDEILSTQASSSSSIQSAVGSAGHIRITHQDESEDGLDHRGVSPCHENRDVCMVGHGKQAQGKTLVRPDWSIVLSYEQKLRNKLRKEAGKKILEGHTLAGALTAVIKDADLKEAYVTTTVALEICCRWRPQQRGERRSPEMVQVANKTFEVLSDAVTKHIGDVRREACKLVTGKLSSSPFPAEALNVVSNAWIALLPDPVGAGVVDEGQPFYLRALAQWLKVFKDPDVHWLVDETDSYASGVYVGVGKPLPRSPQVFPLKTKHRKLDEAEFTPIAENYPSAQISSEELEKKFREEEQLGWMHPSKIGVLKQEYGDQLRIASMAAISKSDGSVRPLHDAIHSVMVNHEILYQDKILAPQEFQRS
eukprot:s929_g5.t1